MTRMCKKARIAIWPGLLHRGSLKPGGPLLEMIVHADLDWELLTLVWITFGEKSK